MFWDCDVRFDLLWRRAGQSDMPVWSVTNHFTAPPLGIDRYSAVAFDASPVGAAVPADAEQLVLRMSVEAADGAPAIQPNAGGESDKGRTPFIRLP